VAQGEWRIHSAHLSKDKAMLAIYENNEKYRNWRHRHEVWHSRRNWCMNYAMDNWTDPIEAAKEFETMNPYPEHPGCLNWEAPDLEIDRINNDGNYSPKNCRWVTIKQNQRNKSNNVYLYIFDRRMCATEVYFSYTERKPPLKVFMERIRRGWGVLDALQLPKFADPKHGKVSGNGQYWD
jgi:hypothetical protein